MQCNIPGDNSRDNCSEMGEEMGETGGGGGATPAMYCARQPKIAFMAPVMPGMRVISLGDVLASAA